VTHLHDDPTPVEHDPTGMRDLLASLPDPGPMPEDLVARIMAALAEESRAAQASFTAKKAGRVVDAPPTTLDAGNVVPLRPHRPTLRHLGVAAAVVTAIGLGGAALGAWPSSLTGPIAALSEASSADSEAGAAPAAPGADESSKGGDAETGARVSDLSATDRLDGVTIVMSGAEHSSDALAAAASALVTTTYPTVTPLTAEAPGIGPIATAIGARTCADALGISPDAGILVDVSEVDGAPAAVLIATDGGPQTSATSSSSAPAPPATRRPSTPRAPTSRRSSSRASVTAGGALMNTTEVENFPGFRDGIMGPDLMENMRAQAERFGAELITDDVESVRLEGDVKVGDRLRGGHRVPGARRHPGDGLGLSRARAARREAPVGHGVSWCATCDGFFFRDQDIAVVGGGDSAVEEATFLTKFARSVTIVHRRDELRASKIMAGAGAGEREDQVRLEQRRRGHPRRGQAGGNHVARHRDW
jgi:hypothetical protein